MENNLKYVYIKLNHFAVYLKQTQYCKPTKKNQLLKNQALVSSLYQNSLLKPDNRSQTVWLPWRAIW